MPFAAVRNPVDTTAQMANDPQLFRRNLEVMLEVGGYDSVLTFLATIGLSATHILADIIEILRDIAKTKPKALMVLSMLCLHDTKREL